MNILMALMMLSMAFVMIAMSAASARRIVEVLDETTDLPPAKQPVQQVADGSIEFDHVTFKYKHGSGQPVLNDITFTIRRARRWASSAAPAVQNPAWCS